jgi:site-specific recombinase XerD
MNTFIDYLQTLNLSNSTIERYNKESIAFLNWYKQEVYNCQKKDVLDYLAYLKKTTKQQNISRNNKLIAIRHYFNYLLEENLIAKNPASLIKIRGIVKRKIPYIYNPQELEELADKYYQLQVKRTQDNLRKGISEALLYRTYYAKIRNYTILTFLIHQGLQTTDILKLQVEDIQLHKANVFIAKGKTFGKERNLPLHATQIGILMEYINNIRPKLNPINETLFVPIPKNDLKAKKETQFCPKRLVQQLKKIDTNFSTLAQIRNSVITYWIKSHGLRKTQYMAGHKSIVSTEEYLPNFIEDLAEEITKYNPF